MLAKNLQQFAIKQAGRDRDELRALKAQARKERRQDKSMALMNRVLEENLTPEEIVKLTEPQYGAAARSGALWGGIPGAIGGGLLGTLAGYPIIGTLAGGGLGGGAGALAALAEEHGDAKQLKAVGQGLAQSNADQIRQLMLTRLMDGGEMFGRKHF